MAFRPLVRTRESPHAPAAVPFLLYRVVLLVKLLGVLGYAGGLGAGLLAGSLPERRRAVHGLASPAIVVVWLSGYVLAERLNTQLTELWVLGGLCGSVVSLGALVVSLHTAGRGWASAVAVGALALVLCFMVFRPTWESVS